MSAQDFAIGQRWISSTEPELGLGIIAAIDGRNISINFPAAEEERAYASNNAPLSRIVYQAGEQLRDWNEDSWTVISTSEQQGCLLYQVENEQGQRGELSELQLSSHVQLSTPKERLLSGQIDKLSRFALRSDTLKHHSRLQQSPLRGLLGARAQLLPHQFYIAAEVASRYAPRVLLADEVGLGKTVEAGLILHQQLTTGLASRVLIVVPDSLVHQWLVEMLRRFNLSFTLLDQERCQAINGDSLDSMFNDDFVEDAPNPFDSAQLILCAQSLIDDEARFEEALAADWDLLIVDEAHHLAWTPEQASTSYQHIEALANKARGLLLLTATPEQLGVEAHYARLRLLDPDRYPSLEKFLEEQGSYQAVSELLQTLLGDEQLSALAAEPALQATLAEYLGAERVAELLQALQNTSEDPATLQEQCCRELLDHHGVGRVLFRNTRSSVSGFPGRALHEHPLPCPEFYQERQASEQMSLSQALQPESLLGDDWLEHDPRLPWLVEWLKQHRQEKVLIICHSAATAEALEYQLSLRNGVRAAAFHQGMSLVERDRAAAWFAETDAGAQVLVCSEIGSEGRNFQFAQHLVCFDLPEHPDLLEQRIGRLDRIGQAGTVNVHVPYYQGTAQAGLLRWYHEGLDAFSRPFPAGDKLYQRYAASLQALLLSNDNSALDDLISDTKAATEEQLAQLQAGRDQLIEFNSCDPKRAEALLTAVRDEEENGGLKDYIEAVFEQYGVDCEPHSELALIAKPGAELECLFPGLDEEGLSATWDRNTALSREDLHFLSWEHPLVNGAMDMVLNSDFGNTAFGSLKLKGLPPGTILVEALFRLSASGAKSLRLGRYLANEPIRLCLESQKGRDIAKLISTEQVSEKVQRLPKRSAQDVIRHARPVLEKLIAQCESLAAKQQQSLCEESLARAEDILGEELARLQALAAINPSIRDAEIRHAQNELSEVKAHIAQADLILEGLRVMMVVDQ